MKFPVLAPVLVGLAAAQLSCVKNSSLTETNALRSDVKILSRKWAVKDAGVLGVPATLRVTVSAPKEFTRLQFALDGETPMTVTRPSGSTLFEGFLPIENTKTGTRKILVAPENENQAIAVSEVNVSNPLLVVVSTDWDDSRFDDSHVERMEKLHSNHLGLKVTHFFAPYHFTDPEISAERKATLTKWVLGQRTTHGDEIGLHLHGWCHFISTTTVPCRTKESFYRDDGTGYTTILAAYSRDEMATILKKGLEVFQANELGKPRSFRAGGWTASAATLQALVDTGFEIDSSAVPPNFIRSWKGYPLFDWLVQNWTGITPKSQPYYPSAEKPSQASATNVLSLLEVPDNGALVDYMKATDMLAVLEHNQPKNSILSSPTLFQVGYHPPSLSQEFFDELDTALEAVDRRLYQRDAGPAVYVNISTLKDVWKQQVQ